MELPCFDRGVRWAKMSSQPGCLPGGSGCARDEREACGGKAPGVDRCGNEGDVNGAYGTVAAGATAIGDATPAGSATAVNESEAVAAAATSQYLAALEEIVEAMWRNRGGSARGSVAWRRGGERRRRGLSQGNACQRERSQGVGAHSAEYLIGLGGSAVGADGGYGGGLAEQVYPERNSATGWRAVGEGQGWRRKMEV